MNDNEIRDILARLQEIEKLQTELRNLLPHATNHVHVEKAKIKHHNLERKSSSTIRFPSLVSFTGISDMSDIKRNDRKKNSREVRSSMIDIKNIKNQQSLKKVTPSKRASVNIIRGSSINLNNSGKDLVNIPEQPAKLTTRNLKSLHSKSKLNDKNSPKVPTIAEKIINTIPKVQSNRTQNLTKSEKPKINNPKVASVDKGNHENGERLPEVKKKSNSSTGRNDIVRSAVTREQIRKQSMHVHVSGNSNRTKKK